jgi:hypothetical protein
VGWRRWLTDGVYVLEVRIRSRSCRNQGNGVDRTTRPTPGASPEPAACLPASESLPSGLKLSRRAPRIPIVPAQLLVDAGYASDQLAVPGSEVAGDMWTRAQSRSALEISDELQRLGSSLRRGRPRLDPVTLSTLRQP